MKVLLVLLFTLININSPKTSSFIVQAAAKESSLSCTKKWRVLSGIVSFDLPENFTQLNDSELASKYPVVGQRPTYVFDDVYGGLKFTINYGSSSATDADLPSIKSYFEKFYKQAGGSVTSEIKKVHNRPIIIMKFEMMNKMGNLRLFNFLFMTSINGKLFMADYSFPSDQKSIQEVKANDILESLTIAN